MLVIHYSCLKIRAHLNVYLVHFLGQWSVRVPAKHTGDRALNKSLIHQNNRGQVCRAMLAVVNRVVLAFFADILPDLVLP